MAYVIRVFKLNTPPLRFEPPDVWLRSVDATANHGRGEVVMTTVAHLAKRYASARAASSEVEGHARLLALGTQVHEYNPEGNGG